LSYTYSLFFTSHLLQALIIKTSADDEDDDQEQHSITAGITFYCLTSAIVHLSILDDEDSWSIMNWPVSEKAEPYLHELQEQHYMASPISCYIKKGELINPNCNCKEQLFPLNLR